MELAYALVVYNANRSQCTHPPQPRSGSHSDQIRPKSWIENSIKRVLKMRTALGNKAMAWWKSGSSEVYVKGRR